METIATTAETEADPIGPLVDLGLTRRQAEIFLYLFVETMRVGYQPSLRDLMARFGIRSPNGIHSCLRALAHKGWVALAGETGRSRAVQFRRNPDGSPFRGFQVRAVD